MRVQMSKAPTAAELELEANLTKLRETVALVQEASEQSALAPVYAALRLLDEAMSAAEDTYCFVQALVGLARAIIAVRQTVQRGPLAELPVPPYDLWLPFKAASLRPSDEPSLRYAAAAPVLNKKIVSELSILLELLKKTQPSVEGLQEASRGVNETGWSE